MKQENNITNQNIENPTQTISTESTSPKKKKYNLVPIKLFGKILSDKRVCQVSGHFINQWYIELKVEIENQPLISVIKAYQERLSESIWEDIINTNYYGNIYCFVCVKRGQSYRLVDWKVVGKVGDEKDKKKKKVNGIKKK